MFLNNHVYYAVKQFVPWRLRLAMRRWRACSLRRAYANMWPIDPRAGSTPSGWPGWPDSKRFALVLTHDVEGRKGLGRVEKLMRLDLEHGFRSTFNFVPEGDYVVPDEVRRTLNEGGFEVGIHGLEHDGKLYRSKTEFVRKAVRIREYLRKWGASGFRSPLMQHRLGWLHALGVEYDASTFDTDPFEPQPDGFGTIFPFWVPGPDGSGYVELPYTLPQDFTLFVVLREETIDIWKRKLDWIAERGGMALVDTHPDYMSFNANERSRDEYPVSHYGEFLTYAAERYRGAFWAATAREVARFYCANVPQSGRNSRKKICMLTHSNYEIDNRVRRYAEALAERGDQVEVIALKGSKVGADGQDVRGVRAYGIQEREHNERYKWTYAWRLLRFFVSSSIFLARRHHRIRYDLIHVHNIPDFLVFAAWYPKLTGAKVILDIHDLVPELFANKFKTNEKGGYGWILKKIERASTAFADHVIVANDLWFERVVSRSASRRSCSVFLNHVDRRLFYQHQRTRSDGRLIVLFPGTFQWHQGLDIAIEAFGRVREKIPQAEFHLYGHGAAQVQLEALTERLGLREYVKFCGTVSLEEIPGIIVNSDLGVVPKRADSFGNEAYSTKIMEFMSQGVPVVAARTKIDEFYFDDSVVRFFRSGDSGDMAEAILEVIENQHVREGLVSAGYEYVKEHSWEERKGAFLDLVDGLSREEFSVAYNVP